MGNRFNKAGTIAVPMQTGMEYGMLVDGAPWEQLYTAATISSFRKPAKPPPWSRPAGLGRRSGRLQQGIYTIAVDGKHGKSAT